MATFAFGEYFGRKKSLIIGVIVMSIGAILQAAATNVPMMIVARLITGVGNGFVVFVDYLYPPLISRHG